MGQFDQWGILYNCCFLRLNSDQGHMPSIRRLPREIHLLVEVYIRPLGMLGNAHCQKLQIDQANMLGNAHLPLRQRCPRGKSDKPPGLERRIRLLYSHCILHWQHLQSDQAGRPYSCGSLLLRNDLHRISNTRHAWDTSPHRRSDTDLHFRPLFD
jgi:hypothetical protein